MRKFLTILQIALKDYYFDGLVSICAVLGFAAVLAPLLILFGVKNGIINTMADRLIEDPRNREVSPIGSGRFDRGWFERVAKEPEVAFIIPQTRSIAANMVLVHRQAGRTGSLAVDLVPTGKGDPLIEKWGRVPANIQQIVLSQPAARKLQVKAGQQLSGRIGRSVGGVRQNVTVTLTVAAVMPLEAVNREVAFVPLELLEATENYRDGFGVPRFEWPGKPRPALERIYPGFRLYARSIYTVAPLRDRLIDSGIEVYTRAEEIDVVQNLDRSFSLIFRLIASVAVIGYFAAMASNTLANVNRKRRHLGITRLIGFSTLNIIWFPVFQAVVTGVLGTVTAIGLYLVTAMTINSLFAQYLASGEYICHLPVHYLVAALVATVAMAIAASAYAAYRVARIEPSEVIRNG